MLMGKKYLHGDINSLLRYVVWRVSSMDTVEAEEVSVQSGTYNPAKYGRAYYLSPTGCKLRIIRQFSKNKGKDAKNRLADDDPMEFEAYHKGFYTKSQVGQEVLLLFFCGFVLVMVIVMVFT